MGERSSKEALFVAVGKVLGTPERLELLDLLSQGPRSVENPAAAGVGTSTCSAHLQSLRRAGLVEPRRCEGKRIYYSLTGDDVAGLWEHLLRRDARAHRPQTESARRAHLGPEDTDTVDTGELLRRLDNGDAVVLDVRPEPEYAGGHLPGAIHIPLAELTERLAELPLDGEIVANCRGQCCVLAHDAVRLLNGHGLHARRATDGVLEWRPAGLLVGSRRVSEVSMQGG